MQVNCSLRTPALTAPLCSYFVSLPITGNGLKEAFPFEGEFIFRLKVSGMAIGAEDLDFLWLDLTGDLPDEELSRLAFNPELLEVQVSPLFKNYNFASYEVCIADDDYTKYLSEVQSKMDGSDLREDFRAFASEEIDNTSNETTPQESSRSLGVGGLFKQISKISLQKKPSMSSLPEPDESAAADSTATKVPIDLTQVKKGVSNLWKAMKSVTSSLGATGQSSSALGNPEVSAHLQDLFNQVNVTFSNNNLQHMDLLENLYVYSAGQLTQTPFERFTEHWKAVGFQKTDPLLDVKTTGLLFLQAMLYLCKRHQTAVLGMMQRNQANSKTNYPFAIVGVNLTLMLIEIFQIRDQKYLTSNAGYWDLFHDKDAFYEIFSICFGHLDSLWVHRKATRADFAALINEVKVLITHILTHNPKSVEDFRLMAQEEGMHVLGL